MPDWRTRFAPSPTGRLHLGHVASAGHVWQAAQEAGGEVLLRIEDIDATRCRPDYTDAIFEDLRWLGFDWPEPVRVQSDHLDEYADTVDELIARGLAYRCFRTRAEIAEDLSARGTKVFTGEALAPDEEARRLDAGHPFAWRLSLDKASEALGRAFDGISYTVTGPDGRQDRVRADPARHGDIALTRKDAPVAYHVAATHDDALQGITHVVRGTDLEDAPHIQVLLQTLMGWPTPHYIHHPLILDADGRKLSKSDGAESLAALRAAGLSAEEVRTRAGVQTA